MHIFDIEAEKNRFLSLKVSEALRKPHFPCPEQILKKKIQKKLFFPSVPDFEQSYRVFEQTSSGVGKKKFYSCQNCVILSRGTLRGQKSLTKIQSFWIRLRLRGAKILRSFGENGLAVPSELLFMSPDE